MQPVQVEYRKVDSLIPYARNARTHSDAQVAQIAASIKEFGWTNPILVDGTNGIIAGHGRLAAARNLAMDAVPVIELAHLTETQKKALILADNKLSLNADWNNEMLNLELEELKLEGFDLNLTGFDPDEVAALKPEIITDGLTDEDAVPEPLPEPITKPGDIWQLGNHRVMCGDSTVITDVEKLMNGKKAALLHADPPYGMGKEKDGIENDNLYADKLDDFQMEWWVTFRTFLEDNASAYIWGNAEDLWRLWFVGGLKDVERLTFRNEVVWQKNQAQGRMSDKCRQYPTGSERCLFFMIGEQGFNNNADNYWEGWEPIRKYLADEWDKFSPKKDWDKHLGNSMGWHYFKKSQWRMPTEAEYKKLQALGVDVYKREYDELKREYDELKREFYSTRAHFDNTHDNMTDVWEYPNVTGEDRLGHATPKPVAMMERVMKSSLPPNGLCIEPFGGSGSTLMGAEKTGRHCYTMELNPVYVDVIVKRWEDFTGKKAVLENGE